MIEFKKLNIYLQNGLPLKSIDMTEFQYLFTFAVFHTWIMGLLTCEAMI